MKQRSILKNAPNIDSIMSKTHQAPASQPVSPMVGDLQRQLSSLSGNSIMLPVCGRNVNFKLETIPADKVEMATMVWLGNERPWPISFRHSSLRGSRTRRSLAKLQAS